MKILNALSANIFKIIFIVEHYKSFFEKVKFFLKNQFKKKMDLNWEGRILLLFETSALTATPQHHRQLPGLFKSLANSPGNDKKEDRLYILINFYIKTTFNQIFN